MTSVRTIRSFPGASYTGPPNRCQIGREQGIVFLSRPQAGGPICVLYVVAGDGRDLLPPLDLRPWLGDADCFAADVFVSGIDGTVKAFVNVHLPGAGGNERALVLVETDIVPEVTT
jgi:hypothetical protein